MHLPASPSVCLIARVRQQLSVLEIVQAGLIIIGGSLPVFHVRHVPRPRPLASRKLDFLPRTRLPFPSLSLSCSYLSSPGLIDLGRSYIALEQSQSVNGSKWEVTRLRVLDILKG